MAAPFSSNGSTFSTQEPQAGKKMAVSKVGDDDRRDETTSSCKT
jgi:hypothetical protein